MPRDEDEATRKAAMAALEKPKAEELKPAREQAREAALAFFCTMNLLGGLAAPRALGRILAESPQQLTRDDLLDVIDHSFSLLQGSAAQRGARGDPRQSAELLRRMRGLIAAWEPSHPAPDEVVQTAREILESFGIPGPDEGWDAWEGPTEGNGEARRKEAGETARLLRPEPMTLDVWADITEPGELVDGRLVEEEAASPLHDAVVGWLVQALHGWAEPRGGWVFGPGYKLGVSDRVGRKSDVSMYLADAPPHDHGAFSRRPPALVIEVLSSRALDVRRDRVEKMHDYARFGVQRYWMVDPGERTVELYALRPGERYALMMCAEEGRIPGVGIEALELDLDALWAATSARSDDKA